MLRHTANNYANLSVDDYQNDSSQPDGKNHQWMVEALQAFKAREARDGKTYPLTFGVVPNGEYQTKLAAADLRYFRDHGCEICNHSWSHCGPGGTPSSNKILSVTYAGATVGASTATLTIGSNALSTTIDTSTDLNLDLTNASYDEMDELRDYINAYKSGLTLRYVGSGHSASAAVTATAFTTTVLAEDGSSYDEGSEDVTVTIDATATLGDIVTALEAIAGAVWTVTYRTGSKLGHLANNLTAATYADVKTGATAIYANPAYTAALIAPNSLNIGTHTDTLADVTAQDIFDTELELELDDAKWFVDEVKAAHDYLVAAGVTPSSVYLYARGSVMTGAEAILEHADNGAYAGGRLAYLAGTTDQTFGIGCNPFEIPCQFLSQASVTPSAAETAAGMTRRDKIFSTVGNVMALGQVVGMPITFYTHPYNWTSGEMLGDVLDAIVSFGTYKSLADICTQVRAQTAVTANRLYSFATVLTNNWQLKAASPLRGIGTAPVIAPVRDLLGYPVPVGVGTDVGAYQYRVWNTLTGATHVDVGERPILLGSTSASVNAAATGTFTITSSPLVLGGAEMAQDLGILQPSIIVQLVPSATLYTVLSAYVDLIPIWTALEDVSPTNEGVVTLCGCRRHDLRRGILGETGLDPAVTGAAQSATAGTPIGSYNQSAANTLIWECQETLPWPVPFVVRVTAQVTNGDGSAVTMYAAAWIVGMA
jgi:hypothetical protein